METETLALENKRLKRELALYKARCDELEKNHESLMEGIENLDLHLSQPNSFDYLLTQLRLARDGYQKASGDEKKLKVEDAKFSYNIWIIIATAIFDKKSHLFSQENLNNLAQYRKLFEELTDEITALAYDG